MPARLMFSASAYAALAKALDEVPPNEGFHVGDGARIREVTSACSRCGLVDWVVGTNVVRPLIPCPFAEGPIETKIRIPVPSGKLAVGCILTSAAAPAAPTIDDGHGLSFIRSHHAAQFWAHYGFAQLNVHDVGFRLLLPGGNGTLVLSDGPPVRGASRVARLNMIMPTFACGDAVRFYPRHQALRVANEIRRDATLTSIVVQPGIYEVTLYHKPEPFPAPTAPDRRMAVRIARVGEVGPMPFTADPDANADAFLTRHPWLRASGAEILLENESALFASA